MPGGTELLASPPSYSYQQSSRAESAARSGDAISTSSFSSGDFSTGGGKSINVLFMVAGAVVLLIFLIKKRK